MVKLAAAECYTVHNLDEYWKPGEKAAFLVDIGLNRTALRLAGPPPRYLHMEIMESDRLRDREESIDNICLFCENINFSRLEEMNHSCDHAVFMEILLSSIKNDTISYQSFVYKVKKESVNPLTTRRSKSATLL